MSDADEQRWIDEAGENSDDIIAKLKRSNDELRMKVKELEHEKELLGGIINRRDERLHKCAQKLFEATRERDTLRAWQGRAVARLECYRPHAEDDCLEVDRLLSVCQGEIYEEKHFDFTQLEKEVNEKLRPLVVDPSRLFCDYLIHESPAEHWWLDEWIESRWEEWKKDREER